ncbi:MAG: tyrosine-protein phosphatase [Candidatus Azobacteroides sp.]|nr:tyrosine-protein phosphatase [Candidatus Azobacteroides sp.]
MFIRILFFIFPLFILASCTKPDIEIETFSCGDGKGNDTVKWDIFPLLEGTVKISSYENPDYPEFTKFEKEVNISDGKTVIPSSGKRNVRKYYYLTFNDMYSTMVSNRFIIVDSIMNLRDLGGYKTGQKQAVKWGKLYRSGRLSLYEEGREHFNSLRVRTVIDLRTEEECLRRPDKNINATIIHLPVAACDLSKVLGSLKKGEFKRGDAFIFMQDGYCDMAANYNRQFARMFEILTDSLNYPALIHCTTGRDRAGFASALILSALGIPEDQIMDDYLLTYSVPDIRSEGKYAYDLSPEGQEAVTALLSSNKQFLETAFAYIKKQYGSMDNYLEQALQLDDKKRNRLKQLLLYYSPN